MNIFKIKPQTLIFNSLSNHLKRNVSNSVVKINYKDLVNNTSEKSQSQIFKAISSAYNKDGLGLMLIQNVPKILQRKKRILDLNYKLVNLPNESLKKVELPEKNYSIG